MLMLDQLCLPGCEGGGVFDRFGALVGVCIITDTPLKRKKKLLISNNKTKSTDRLFVIFPCSQSSRQKF
jgi:hypothetical protein